MNKVIVSRSLWTSLLLLSLSSCSTPSFPYGTFVSETGSYQLVLNDNGAVTFSEYEAVVTTGTFSINGNELTWETDSYCDERSAGKATYTWRFEDDPLILHVKVEDACADRLFVLDGVAYYLEQ